MSSRMGEVFGLAVALLLLLTNQARCWHCDVNQTVCDVWLDVRYGLTMMKDKTLVVARSGSLFPYDATNLTAENAIPMEDVVTADGWADPGLVITVNGTLPGPLLEVHENQTVRVHLRNLMLAEATSLHFHGQHQLGTSHMDGAAFINQCPVLPGQTFVHEFKAYPAGTHWYHSHVGGQTGMGFNGGLVVHPREGKDPRYHRQFTLLVQNWNHDWEANMEYLKMDYGMYVNGKKAPPRQGLTGVKYSSSNMQSVLINGRGRYQADGNASHNGAPLSAFSVRKGSQYRFRLIHPGSPYPFAVSVDGHRIRVVATDGADLKEPVLADSVVLTPGERYDFELTADQPVNNYWIRAESLEVTNKHTGLAVLRYEGAPRNTDPITHSRTCRKRDPCLMVNCPFARHPQKDRYHCVTVDDLRSKEKMPTELGRGAKKVKQVFLNFAFPGTTFTPASVNGIQMVLPTVSALTQPLEFSSRCPGDGYRCQEDKLCACTAVLDLKAGEVVQLVFLNLGIGQGWDHPVHLHGHYFHVLKVGFPRYHPVTGNILGPNQDVDCRGNADRRLSFCNNATWSDPSWSGNAVPGLELDYPVMKDTVNVPTGGYVVARLRADNPGVWPMHCHVGLHLEDGMMVLVNESYPQHPPSPPGFPQCRDFVH